jgi:hypothetical protein
MAGFEGIPRRYICSAKYLEGSNTRYLIREVYSPKTGDALREAVIDLFVSDLEGPRALARNPSGAGEKVRDMNRVYLTGKLTDLTIDELKERKIPFRKTEN